MIRCISDSVGTTSAAIAHTGSFHIVNSLSQVFITCSGNMLLSKTWELSHSTWSITFLYIGEECLCTLTMFKTDVKLSGTKSCNTD